MSKETIAIPTNMGIEKFDGAVITRLSAYIENGVVGTFPNGNKFVTQRPSFSTIEVAADQAVDAMGRGIYFWRLVNNTYICNYDTIYVDGYTTALAAGITAGKDRVYWAELADKLFMLDVEGNAAYYIDDAAPTTLNTITDADFPDTSLSYTLADGCAVLDNTLYVLANLTANNAAYIYGSDLNDMTAWDGNNYITASKNSDRGVYIGKHKDNIFVLGNESLEFFYNAANEVGSPLSARQDLSYNIGCADGQSVFIDNDDVYFVGKSSTSGLGVYRLRNFELEEISISSIDSYLTSSITNEGLSVVGSGLFTQGMLFYILTVYNGEASSMSPQETLVYNSTTGIWTFWEHSSSTVSQFPLVQWVSANDVSGANTATGKGIFSNGDWIECRDDFIPSDRSGSSGVFVDDVFVSGTFSETSTLGDAIVMTILCGHNNFDTQNRKSMDQLRPVCDSTEAVQTLSLRWTDDNHVTYTTARTLDLSNANDKLTRLGPFRSRNIELSYSGSEAIRLEGLEAEVVLLDV